MGKLTIILEHKNTPTKKLEEDAHRYFGELRQSNAIPRNADVFVVPDDEAPYDTPDTEEG